MKSPRILFANVGWMIHYRGNNTHDQIVGGGSYRDDDKHEAYNFLPLDGRCYGYVQPNRWKRIKLNRIDKGWDGEELDNVLVVWIAPHPKSAGTYIVGWYKNATVFSEFQYSDSLQRNKYGFNIVADAKDCTLVPVDKRIFQIPRAVSRGKGFLGQSNVWYADSSDKAIQLFRKEVYEYIQAFTSTSRHISKQSLKVDAEARKRVEQAAVSYVTKEYQGVGYKVVSREKENIGWDLDAKKGDISLKLEVKGLAQSEVSVRISENEYNAMAAHKESYRLCVVTNALKKPTLITFIWDDVVNAWVSEADPSTVLSIELKPSYLAVVE